MKILFATFLLGLFIPYAWSDNEYYLGDVTSYVQINIDQSKLPPGFIAIPKGTVLKLATGFLPKNPQVMISSERSTLKFKNESIYLERDRNSDFLASNLVKLSKGGYIQYFRSQGKSPDQLIRYNSDRLPVEIIDLIKKRKTEQDAAANP